MLALGCRFMAWGRRLDWLAVCLCGGLPVPLVWDGGRQCTLLYVCPGLVPNTIQKQSRRSQPHGEGSARRLASTHLPARAPRRDRPLQARPHRARPDRRARALRATTRLRGGRAQPRAPAGGPDASVAARFAPSAARGARWLACAAVCGPRAGASGDREGRGELNKPPSASGAVVTPPPG